MPGFEAELHRSVARETVRFFWLTAIVSLALTGLMLLGDREPLSALGRVMPVVAGCVGLLALVTWRSHPLVFARWLRPRSYARAIRNEARVIETLHDLRDTAFVANGFILELFRVEHLVVSSRGVFVLGKFTGAGALHVRNGVLFSGEKSLETLTASLWRICHLLRIVIRKGFDAEVMPTPVLVTTDGVGPCLDTHDGIRILRVYDLNGWIRSCPETLDPELENRIGGMILSRYCSGG